MCLNEFREGRHTQECINHIKKIVNTAVNQNPIAIKWAINMADHKLYHDIATKGSYDAVKALHTKALTCNEQYRFALASVKNNPDATIFSLIERSNKKLAFLEERKSICMTALSRGGCFNGVLQLLENDEDLIKAAIENYNRDIDWMIQAGICTLDKVKEILKIS